MLWEKKTTKTGKLELGLDVKRCASCGGPTRPCLVDDKPALFHRWVDEDKDLLHINTFTKPDQMERLNRAFRDTGIIPPCCSVEVLRITLALVEYPDGSVGKVKPELIQFLDRKEK